MPTGSGGGGGAGKVKFDRLSIKKWADADLLDDADLLKRLSDEDRDLVGLFSRFDDLLVDGDAEVHLVGLLLPAVQKVREAAGAPAAADFFLKVEGFTANDAEAFEFLKREAALLDDVEIEVLEIRGGGRELDKATPLLAFKVSDAGSDDARDEHSAWNPLADFDFGGGNSTDL
ncbi:hypothetical protein P2H44_09395 [Albimonas sp. CAU 1670]|uniref:hypothetical protein n=1 Tax=Albimonas sp. CAU 1670 TaxID=3032599 RepID=UPI0023DA3EED|nr:hypothetical protein [Albimonas sp. CAU 1670]MDF2232766.1 hypothetical protein [Albimonas sp. CAU 1670]